MIKNVKVKNIGRVEKGLKNKQIMEAFPDQPMNECPRCGLLVPDFDGLTFTSHIGKPDDRWPDPCGYCTHPAMDGNVCAICGAVEGTTEFMMAKLP